jgi:hypothetical protein
MPSRHRFRHLATLRGVLGWGPRARPPVIPASRCFVVLTDGPTGVAHRVTGEAFAAGHAEGHYVALCGAPLLPARLTAPTRFHCPVCERGV